MIYLSGLFFCAVFSLAVNPRAVLLFKVRKKCWTCVKLQCGQPWPALFFQDYIGILFPKLFQTNVRKKCYSDREKHLTSKADFARFLRSRTGKSLSEALIFASINPQFDNRLFIELGVQYMKIPSSEHVVYTNCSEKQFLYTTCSPQVWAWNFHVLNL